MKGYIYIMSPGSDPEQGWYMNDPWLGKTPTLGACMPNIRRLVYPGDHIFVISGKMEGVRQYLVGGFSVEEKIHALEAFDRFPELRMRRTEAGDVHGNIILDEMGSQHPLDDHRNFEKRLENYIVGRDPKVLMKKEEVQKGRHNTLNLLSELFKAKGVAPYQVMGRWHRLEGKQIRRIYQWLDEMRG